MFTGYVSLAIATLLSQHHQVKAVDIILEKDTLINDRKSSIQDSTLKIPGRKGLNLIATLEAKVVYSNADFVVITAPTDCDSSTQRFDTADVENTVENIIEIVMQYNPNGIMVIKTTIPVDLYGKCT